jgi:hypothetical protein
MHPDQMGISKETAKTTKLLKLQPYKTMAVHPLQPHNGNFWGGYFNSIHDSKLGNEVTFL